jgi:1-acyl-sn-glycerol-3-phosphate acyltransferase
MLYAILRFLFKITGRVFFSNITIRNKELIPKSGPLIVVANHPSAFMDPIVIATIFERNLYFLGKGILFKSKLGKWILPKFNTIPIYRRADDPSEMNKNEDTFRTCYQYLEKGAAILIFPEGITKTERKLGELKTGAARIALGAEAKNNFKLNVQIITVGLNYANPHKFNRGLFINIAQPISISTFQNEYETDNVNSVLKVTEMIKVQLEQNIIAIGDQKIDELSRDIEYLYKYKLVRDWGDDQHSGFLLTKNIIAAVTYFINTEPLRAEKMAIRIKQYLRNVAATGLKDEHLILEDKKKMSLGKIIFSLIGIIVGLPFFIYGFINNILPFIIPGWIAAKVASRKEFIGSIGMAMGLLTFIIFYTLQIILVGKFFDHFWITLFYALSLPVSGLYAFGYFHTIKKIKARWLLLYIFNKKSVFIANLIAERENIIAEFDIARAEFAAYRETK